MNFIRDLFVCDPASHIGKGIVIDHFPLHGRTEKAWRAVFYTFADCRLSQLQ